MAVSSGNPEGDLARALETLGRRPGDGVVMPTAFDDYRMPGYTPPAAGGDDDTPLLSAQMKQDIANAKGLTFSTPADNKANNTVPDYRLTLGSDGQLHLEKVGDGPQSKDGKLNVEIDPQNKSLEEAIKSADQNMKEYVREMMTLWQKDHPGEGHPGWWDDVLNGRPNIPDHAQPLNAVAVPAPPPTELPAWPTPAAQPQPGEGQAPPAEAGPAPGYAPSPGGNSPGLGGFANHGGFDDQGMYNSRGADQDGSVWTGNENARGEPIGPGEQAKAKDIYDYLVDPQKGGFTPAQASGILGNIQTESSFKTNAYNRGEGAIGICQWEGPRRAELQAFADAQHKPVTDLHVQLDFMMYEFQHKEKGAFAAVKAAQTPEQAAVAFQSKYERSASLGNRAANARQIYAQLGNTRPGSDLVA